MFVVLEVIILIFRTLYICLVQSIKAFIPNGVLPRKNVKGDVVLITGGGSGIGRIMALEFSKLGSHVVLWDVNEKGNKETQQMVLDAGGKATSYTVDVTKKADVYKKGDQVRKEVGNVDILINNAGIVSGKRLIDLKDVQIEKTMAVNATSHFYTTRAFLPHMLENDKGHIVTIASIAGKVGADYLTDYCASKFAAVGFHETLTAELHAMGKDEIKTTVVCPYVIDTGMFKGFKATAPSILPGLTPTYVVECIMEAVLTNRKMVAVPKFNYIVSLMNEMMPTEVNMLVADFFNINDSMKSFTGRQ